MCGIFTSKVVRAIPVQKVAQAVDRPFLRALEVGGEHPSNNQHDFFRAARRVAGIHWRLHYVKTLLNRDPVGMVEKEVPILLPHEFVGRL